MFHFGTKAGLHSPMTQNKWTISYDRASKASFAKYNQKHPRETASVFSNLARVIDYLQSGRPIEPPPFGFLRSEGKGLYRIGQTGVKSAKETRLYIFFAVIEKVIHVLGIGDKGSQKRDIQNCLGLVGYIMSEQQRKGNSNERD
ncbi:MAG: hypothetical protein RRC34_04925 [Lentisphaeria bacterium]|nr:hypothetical protein [Lentisphaeria bacterium]